MDTSLEIKELNCKVQGHDGTPVTGFCIDENCTNKNKFICSECFYDVHFGHKAIKIKELNILIQDRNNDYKQYFEEEQKILEIYNEHELDQKEKVYKLKRDILNKMEKNIDRFFEGLNTRYNELKKKNIRNFENLKEYKNFFKDNVSISDQDLDLNKLTDLCINICKEIEDEKEIKLIKLCFTIDKEINKRKENEQNKVENEKQETIINKNIIKINNELKQIKNFDKYIKKQSSLLINYINENFLK